MKIAVYGPLYNDRSKSTIKILIDYLKSKKANVLFEKTFYESIVTNSSIDLISHGFNTFKV